MILYWVGERAGSRALNSPKDPLKHYLVSAKSPHWSLSRVLTVFEMEKQATDLAIAVHTETTGAFLTQESALNTIQRYSGAEALEYVKNTVAKLCAEVRKSGRNSCELDQTSALETALQQREAELRQKTKVELELRLELAETQKALALLGSKPCKDAATCTEVERPVVEIARSLLEDPYREEKDRLAKALALCQAAAKRDQQVIWDLERKISRMEVELMEFTDQLAEKARECERWRKDCAVLSLSSRHKDFLPVAFSHCRKQLTRKRLDAKSSSPVKVGVLRRETSSKSLFRPTTPSSLRTLSEPCSDLVFGRAVALLKPRNSSVRDLKRVPLLRKRPLVPS